jgi:hypothetical protein
LLTPSKGICRLQDAGAPALDRTRGVQQLQHMHAWPSMLTPLLLCGFTSTLHSIVCVQDQACLCLTALSGQLHKR